MTERDRPAFAEALHVLAETYGEQVSELRAEGYFQALSDLPIEAVNTATLKALRVCKFFPRPVELREMVEGNADERADAAWSAMLREIRRVGYLGTPTFNDERVLNTICDVWGNWRRLCETLPGEGPELVGWMKQFKSAYRSVGVRVDHDRFLTGMPADVRKLLAGLAQGKSMAAAPTRAEAVQLDALDQIRKLRAVK